MRRKDLGAWAAIVATLLAGLLLSGCTVRVAAEAGLFRDPPQPKVCPAPTPVPVPRFSPEPPDVHGGGQ